MEHSSLNLFPKVVAVNFVYLKKQMKFAVTAEILCSLGFSV